MTDSERKRQFVRALARFLVGMQAGKSIALALEAKRNPVILWAQEWAELRQATPLFGYPTVEMAEKELADFLGVAL